MRSLTKAHSRKRPALVTTTTSNFRGGRLREVLKIGLPVQTNVVFRLDASLMGVGRLRAVSYFSFESQYIESTLERGSGGTPYNGLFGEAPPKGAPFSGFRYLKG